MLLFFDIDEKIVKVGKRKVLIFDSIKKVILENIKLVVNSIFVYSIESDGIFIIKKL